MSFEISSNYLNKKCGLHLIEYQKPNPNNPDEYGIIDSNGKFIKCACHQHITREEYNEVIPKIVDELYDAGVFKTLEYFNKDINIHKIYEDLKKDNVDISKISAQKTSSSNKIIRKHQVYFCDVKNHKGENVEFISFIWCIFNWNRI